MIRKLLLLSFSLTLLPSLSTAAQPNVVIFLVDDMGVMDTSVPFLTDDEGNPERHPLNDWYRTPSMERLAASGIRFSTFYAQSVCSPTRVSIVTGQNAARHHTTQFIKPDSNNRGEFGPEGWGWKGIEEGTTTLPGILSANGYHSIHVGKAHFGPEESFAENPENIGFDENIAGHAWGAPASYYGEKNYANPKGRGNDVPGLEKYHGTETFLTEALTVEAKEALTRTVEKDQPFFLHLSHYAVHSPFHEDPRFAANYPDEKNPAVGKKAPARAFATLIEGMDKSLGDILDHLDSLGVAEDTLLFFLGDNGSDAPLGPTHEIASSAPLRGKKATHYEGGMRVPFIASWAKPNPENQLQKALPIPSGAIQSQSGTTHDLFATILEATAIQPPESHISDGTSLKKLLSGQPDASREDEFLMHFPHKHRSSYFTSYRLKDWKLIYHYHPERRTELFHLPSDPAEQTDRSSSDPEVLERMIKAMAEALENEGAQYAVDKEANPIEPTIQGLQSSN